MCLFEVEKKRGEAMSGLESGCKSEAIRRFLDSGRGLILCLLGFLLTGEESRGRFREITSSLRLLFKAGDSGVSSGERGVGELLLMDKNNSVY
jgi:hypothetical protein